MDQPAARIFGDSVVRPLRCGRDERFLHGVFSRRKFVEAPDDGSEHLRRKFAQQMLERYGWRLFRHAFCRVTFCRRA